VEDKDEFKPKLQTESSGGNGPGGKTRIGANTPSESGGPKRVQFDKCLTVKELASKMSLSETTIIKVLFHLGVPRTVNQIVELPLARQTAHVLGYEIIET